MGDWQGTLFEKKRTSLEGLLICALLNARDCGLAPATSEVGKSTFDFVEGRR
jgi:hypothetical protein